MTVTVHVVADVTEVGRQAVVIVVNSELSVVPSKSGKSISTFHPTKTTNKGSLSKIDNKMNISLVLGLRYYGTSWVV